MKYDIASKRLVELGKKSILKYLLGLETKESELIEKMPVETVSVRISDFSLMVKDMQSKDSIVLLEFQTQWKEDKILDLIDYTTRIKKNYPCPVKPVMLLFTESEKAKSIYEDENIIFHFELIKIWEKDPKELLNAGMIELFPMIPLIKNGIKYISDAESGIYNSDLDSEIKSDLLTILTIFIGLKDKELAWKYLLRRKDIMVESPVYDMIIEEGIEKGIKKGIEKGIEKGIKEGIEKGKRSRNIEIAKNLLKEESDIKFIAKVTGLSIKEIKNIQKD